MDNELTGIEKLRKYAEGLSMTAGFRFAQEYGCDLLGIYEQIWREQSEDHEIAEWVREQGGIGILKLHEETFKELKCERDGYKACAKLLDKVYSIINPDESDERPFEKGDTIISSFKKIREELNKRLMPSGMEWMKIEGEPMDTTAIYEVDGEPVKIWSIGYYGNKDVQEVEVEMMDGSENIDSVKPSKIKRPKQDLIGADGLPIKKGDTVYATVEGGPYKVIDVSDKGSVVVDAFSDMGMDGSMFTHAKPEPPDSWERWRRDMMMPLDRYVEDVMGEDITAFDYIDLECMAASHKERRAKALAERERDK